MNCARILYPTVPVIGFEQTQYTVAEDDVDGIEVCVSLMTPPSLDREVTVSLSSQDGTAEGWLLCCSDRVSEVN